MTDTFYIYWNDLTEEAKKRIAPMIGSIDRDKEPIAVGPDDACEDCRSCRRYLEGECGGDTSSCYYREETY